MTRYTPGLLVAVLSLLLLIMFVVIHSGLVLVIMPTEDYARYCAAYPTRCP